MDIKKLAAGTAGAALFLSAALPAFAWFDSATIVSNHARLNNFTLTVANSGLNGMMAEDDVEGGSIATGEAVAIAGVANVVNTTEVTPGEDAFTLVHNRAGVRNTTLTFANSGLNGMMAGDDVEGGSIETGMAGAESVVANVVNTTVVNAPVED